MCFFLSVTTAPHQELVTSEVWGPPSRRTFYWHVTWFTHFLMQKEHNALKYKVHTTHSMYAGAMYDDEMGEWNIEKENKYWSILYST